MLYNRMETYILLNNKWREQMKLRQIKQKQEPKGKRSYRWNILGNFVGYVGRKRWMSFDTEFDAKEWVAEQDQK